MKQQNNKLTTSTSTFDGSTIAEFFIKIGITILTILTFGLAFWYLVCAYERWNKKHTVYDGKRLIFEGDAKSLFLHHLLWILLTILTLGIYAFVIGKKAKQFIATNTHFQNIRGEKKSERKGSIVSIFFIALAKHFLSIISIGILNTAYEIRVYKYDIEHTIIDGRKLRFDGKTKDVFRIRTKRLFFGILTLGIYLLFNRFKFKRWLCENTHFA